jgi:hypothetical protein
VESLNVVGSPANLAARLCYVVVKPDARSIHVVPVSYRISGGTVSAGQRHGAILKRRPSGRWRAEACKGRRQGPRKLSQIKGQLNSLRRVAGVQLWMLRWGMSNVARLHDRYERARDTARRGDSRYRFGTSVPAPSKTAPILVARWLLEHRTKKWVPVFGPML